MKTLVLCAVAAVALAGCIGSEPEPTPTPEPTATATPSLTNTPGPTATATPDPKVSQVEAVAERIEAMRASVSLTLLDLLPAARLYTGTRVLTPTARQAADILDGWESTIKRCEQVGMPALMLDQDLWPGPYRNLASAHWSTCQAIGQRHKELGEPAAEHLEWIALAVSVVDALTEAHDALPDYSSAQLRRAIADRQ